MALFTTNCTIGNYCSLFSRRTGTLLLFSSGNLVPFKKKKRIFCGCDVGSVKTRENSDRGCIASSSDRFPVRTNARLGAARECSTAVLLLALQKSISGVIGDGPRMHCSGEELTYRKLVRIVLEQQSGRLGATF